MKRMINAILAVAIIFTIVAFHAPSASAGVVTNKARVNAKLV